MDISFTEQELKVIELMAPGKSAEEIINLVLRDWFNTNVDRMYKQVKPQAAILAEIINVAKTTTEAAAAAEAAATLTPPK